MAWPRPDQGRWPKERKRDEKADADHRRGSCRQAAETSRSDLLRLKTSPIRARAKPRKTRRRKGCFAASRLRVSLGRSLGFSRKKDCSPRPQPRRRRGRNSRELVDFHQRDTGGGAIGVTHLGRGNAHAERPLTETGFSGPGLCSRAYFALRADDAASARRRFSAATAQPGRRRNASRKARAAVAESPISP
jgi:hypothetical protein